MVVSKLSSIKQQYLDDLKVLFQLHEQNSLNNTNSIIFQRHKIIFITYL
jgi:hypothetical protein